MNDELEIVLRKEDLPCLSADLSVGGEASGGLEILPDSGLVWRHEDELIDAVAKLGR